MRTLYFAFIYSKILYGIENYDNTFEYRLHDLIILNNRILRVAQDKKWNASTIDLYRDFNTLPIPKLFKFKMLTHAHSLFYNSPYPIFHSAVLANSQIHDHYTRTQNDFHRTSTSTRMGDRVSLNVCSKL